MKHDIEIELAYLSWKKEPQNIAIWEKRMRQALEECERIHGTSSQHFCYMTSVMTEFLCCTGDFETALRCNDKAFEHYHNGASMMHFACQTLSRDRMAIMLGLGRIEEATEIGKTILDRCEYHHPVKLFCCYKDLSTFESLGINESSLKKDDLNKLRQLAPTLICHHLPLICPSDSDLVKAPSPLSVTKYSQCSILSFSVIDALIILAQLENDTINKYATKVAGQILQSLPQNRNEYRMISPFDEKVLRLFELVEKNNCSKDLPDFNLKKVLKYRRWLYSPYYYSDCDDELCYNSDLHYSDLNLNGDIMLHFAIKMFDDNIEVNALPFYNDYVRQKQQLFKKPLDQLTPKEQGLRRRYLIDENRYATAIKHFESLRIKYF